MATCSTGSVSAIENLGPDVIVDYKQPDSETRLHDMGGYAKLLLLLSRI